LQWPIAYSPDQAYKSWKVQHCLESLSKKT
jgi:hypothetical protein